MSFKRYNANPVHNRTIDCTIRAISTVLDVSWREAYLGVVLEGYIHYDMPSSDRMWTNYLQKKGFTQKFLYNVDLTRYTVKDFCRDHYRGRYLLKLDNHVVAVIDGNYYDTWDSGYEPVFYYWSKGD